MITYKLKLQLSKDQEIKINNWIGTCRLVYNMGLEIKKETWKNKQINVSEYDLMKQLTEIKDIDFIKSAPSQSLQYSIQNLEKTYKNFFRTRSCGGGFPKFKTKKEHGFILFKNSKIPSIKISNNKIKLPKISPIKFFKNKTPIIGNIKTATIVKKVNGYFISIVTDNIKNISSKDESQVLGLDMGICNFYTDSNGMFLKNPINFNEWEKRIMVEKRSLSRKKKGSSRWKKQSKRVGLIYNKIFNIRQDFLHKESTKIAKKYHTVFMENLIISEMASASKSLSKDILNFGWGYFKKMLSYKTNLFLINPRYTSQCCNVCGFIDSKSRISQSEFVCTNCGIIENADINAAKNILSRGTALNR